MLKTKSAYLIHCSGRRPLTIQVSCNLSPILSIIDNISAFWTHHSILKPECILWEGRDTAKNSCTLDPADFLEQAQDRVITATELARKAPDSPVLEPREGIPRCFCGEPRITVKA